MLPSGNLVGQPFNWHIQNDTWPCIILSQAKIVSTPRGAREYVDVMILRSTLDRSREYTVPQLVETRYLTPRSTRVDALDSKPVAQVVADHEAARAEYLASRQAAAALPAVSAEDDIASLEALASAE